MGRHRPARGGHPLQESRHTPAVERLADQDHPDSLPPSADPQARAARREVRGLDLSLGLQRKASTVGRGNALVSDHLG